MTGYGNCFCCKVTNYALELHRLVKNVPDAVETLKQTALNYQVSQSLQGWSGVIAAGKHLQSNSIALGLGKQRLTLAMIDQMEPLSKQEKIIILGNWECEEYSLVAWLLWWRLLQGEELSLLTEMQLQYVPLREHHRLKDPLDQLRLAQPYHGEKFTTMAQALRKFSQLAGRDLGDADWETEKVRSGHEYAFREKHIPPSVYGPTFRQHANLIIHPLGSELSGKNPPTLDNWWSKRALSAPSGSSSLRHVVDEHKTKSIHSSDRPTKRTVYAMLPDDYPRKLLATTPHLHARCSTKPEPGRKHRALYAGCDCNTILQSYASHGIESCMRFGGMVSRQDPKDLLAWFSDHHNSQTARGCWLSLDYSDFNKEHRWWEQATINYLLAIEWATAPVSSGAADKAFTSLWVARACKTRSASRKDESWYPSNGLFSGERNTARDNTLLHKIYSGMMLEWAQMLNPLFTPPAATWMCGDDEDSLFHNEGDAYLYYATGAAAGWHFNPRKQLLGPNRHEFLQYELNSNKPPTQPLAAATVAFVEGSWYKNPVLDLAGLPSAVIRNAQALIARNGNPQVALHAAAKYLNSHFKNVYGTPKRWDSLLDEELLASPIGQVFTKKRPSPTIRKQEQYVAKEQNTIPAPAINQTLERLWPLIETLPEGARKSIERELRSDVFDSWYTHARRKNYRPPQLADGPVPYAREQPQYTLPELDQVVALGDHLVDTASTTTHTQAAAFIGIPLPLYRQLNLAECVASGRLETAPILATVDEIPTDPLVKKWRNQFLFNLPF